MPSVRELSALYRSAHNTMRNVDGLQPQEAFDELLKYLFFKQNYEIEGRGDEEIGTDEVRRLFSLYLTTAITWSGDVWRDKQIFLSDECLSDIHSLLFPIQLSKVNYDIRSHALKEFLTSEIRKGLGIFLTPDEVVAAIVDFVPSAAGLRVTDPACGSGTFLVEYLKKLKPTSKVSVEGTDKNPRMALLADLNLGHFDKVDCSIKSEDALKDGELDDQYDLILTNPPFGVSLDARDYDFARYETCKDENGYLLNKQTSEIVFIERCLQRLKPGGTLAIVIPKSIATNNSLQVARAALGRYGFIHSIMSLPPETFSATGTQTTTIVLFVEKYRDSKDADHKTKLALANIRNVGFDSTGRVRDGSELDHFTQFVRTAFEKDESFQFVDLIPFGKKSETFSDLSSVFIAKKASEDDIFLGDICSYIGTGRTPARKDYAEEGSFLVKVGNLTGSGINWEARDRNYISDAEAEKRSSSKRPLTLKSGDILLTSSAHSPVYIAKKSDIYTGTPSFLSTRNVAFVGEVMLIRAKPDVIDPFVLLAYLRSNSVMLTIQRMVRGQTAHLHAKDLSQLALPKELLSTDTRYSQVAELIREQCNLSERMNELAERQSVLLAT